MSCYVLTMTIKKPNLKPDGEKEVYILKIYHRGEDPLTSLVGTIEEIRGEKKGSFKTGEELLHWIGEEGKANESPRA